MSAADGGRPLPANAPIGTPADALTPEMKQILGSGRGDALQLLVKANLAMLRQAVQREQALKTTLEIVSGMLAPGDTEIRKIVDKAIEDNEA